MTVDITTIRHGTADASSSLWRKTAMKENTVLPGTVLLVGLMLLGCRSEGERLLIGSWERVAIQNIETSQPSGLDQRADRFGHMFQRLEHLSLSLQPDVTVSFGQDGTYTESVGYGDRRNVEIGSWQLVTPGEEQITVRIELPDESVTDATLRFVNDDELIFPTQWGNGVRMVRRDLRGAPSNK